MDTPVTPTPPVTPPNGTVGKNLFMGILAYIGPLIIVSYLVAKDDPFVKFHIKQGLVLVVVEVAMWVLGMFLGPFWMLASIVNLAVFILAIIGIVNAAQGKEGNLPLVGGYASKFNF